MTKFDMVSHSEFVRLLREEEIRAFLEAEKIKYPDIDIETRTYFFHIIQVYKKKAEFTSNILENNRPISAMRRRSYKVGGTR